MTDNGQEYQFEKNPKYEEDDVTRMFEDPFSELLKNVKKQDEGSGTLSQANKEALAVLNTKAGNQEIEVGEDGLPIPKDEVREMSTEEDHFEFSDSEIINEGEDVEENKQEQENKEIVSEGENNTMDSIEESEEIQEIDSEGENNSDDDELETSEEIEEQEEENEEASEDSSETEMVDKEFYDDIMEEEQEEEIELEDENEEENNEFEENDEDFSEESGFDVEDDIENDEESEENESDIDELESFEDEEENAELEEDLENEVNHIELEIENSDKAKKLFGDVLISNAAEQLRPYFDSSMVNIAEVDDDGNMDLVCPICGASVDNENLLTEDDIYDFSKQWYNQHISLDKDFEFEYLDCENCKLTIKRRWEAKKQLANTHLVTSIMYITDALGIQLALNDTLDIVPSNKITGVGKKVLQLLYPTDKFICVDDMDQIYVFTYLSLIETFKKLVDYLDLKDDYENEWEKYLYWLENDKDGLIAREFKDKGYDLQLEWLQNNTAITLEELNKFSEETTNDVYCKHNCKECPQEFTCDNLNELIEHSFTMNGDPSKCSIYAELTKDSVENLSIEKLPPLTDEEISCIRRNKPKAKDLEPYISAYLKIEKYKNLNKDFIKELGIRDWITVTLQAERTKEASKNLDKELFGFDDSDDQAIRMDGQSTKREGLDYRNDKTDNWKEDEYSSWISEENRKRRERMEEGRVRAEDLLKGISEDEDEIDPALEDLTLKDTFKKSPFYEMIQYVIADKRNNTAQLQVQCNKNTNYVPIIDTSTGFRFVCVETDDSVVRMYNFNPITLSSQVSFWYREHRNSYKTYVLYKCDVKVRKRQIAAAIVKLINYGVSYSERRICRLNDDYIPVYNTERAICDEYFEKHSLLAFDRFGIESLIVLGIINNEKYKDSYVYKRKEIYKNQIERFSKNKMLSSEGSNIAGLAGIRYYAVNQTNSHKELIGRTYIITQYTENANLLLENGLWYCILALMKEHEKNYNSGRRLGSDRIWMEISFEFDRATVPSPIITTMIAEDGCLSEDTRNYIGTDFEVNQDYKAMNLAATMWAGIIPNPSDRRPGVRRDDAVIDIRWFKTEALMKKFFGNEIGPDVKLTTRDEKQTFLRKKGYDEEFTVPEAMRFDVRAETLRELLNGDSYRDLEMISFNHYNQEQIDSIIGDHNAQIVRDCMGPVWEEIAKKAPSNILGNTLKKIGQNIDMNLVKDILGQFKRTS